MKVFIDKDSSDYIEAKNDGRGCIDLSIRTRTDKHSSIVVTAKLDSEILDKLIANLILLKSRIPNEEK